MHQNHADRNVCRILPVVLLLVLGSNSLLADLLTITGTATFSTVAGIAVGDEWTGTLTTDGTCPVCTPANGGLLGMSLDIYGDIIYVDIVNNSSNVEGYPAFPSFDRTSGNLTLAATVGPFTDVIGIGGPPPNNGTFSFSRPEQGGVNGAFGVTGGAPCSVSTSNTSNFNGTSINPGTFLVQQ